MQKMMRGKEGFLSLAQGIVHWKPRPRRGLFVFNDTKEEPRAPAIKSLKSQSSGKSSRVSSSARTTVSCVVLIVFSDV